MTFCLFAGFSFFGFFILFCFLFLILIFLNKRKHRIKKTNKKQNLTGNFLGLTGDHALSTCKSIYRQYNNICAYKRLFILIFTIQNLLSKQAEIFLY